jgi:F-type H+-transporting ATPase subunit b
MFLTRTLLALCVAGWLLLAAGRPVVAADESHGPNAAHTDAAHAEQAGPDPLAVDVDLAVWTLIIFLLLMFVLKKFAWGPIAAGLDQRERTIAEHIAVAESASAEGKRLLAEYEKKLAAAQDEVRGILDQARKHAEHVHQEILEKGREEAAAEIKRGKREIETAKDEALAALAEASANQAVELAGKILGSRLDAGNHRSLIEQSLASFPDRVKLRN